MCRSIRTLHNFDPPATDEEVHAAALQYVRKIMGGPRPSQSQPGRVRPGGGERCAGDADTGGLPGHQGPVQEPGGRSRKGPGQGSPASGFPLLTIAAS